MAGGVGSRFWPASREDRPKQFLDILGVGKSLLRLTFERCARITSTDKIFVMTNDAYRDQVSEHLPEISEEQIFLEPSRNNTAPCIALASLKLKKRYGTGVCLVAPSDAVILKEDVFVAQADKAMDFAAENDVLVTLGIQPVRPDTGYGYIQYEDESDAPGVHKVARFTEKPDKETARGFLASGDYLWNSGMFVWSLSSVLGAFEKNAPSIVEILQHGENDFFTVNERQFLNKNYPKTEKISIDYAIMEKANNVFVLPSDLGWSDLGTWGSLFEYLEGDEAGNVHINANLLGRECKNNLVYSRENKLIVISDVDDLIVVDDNDVLLILPREKEQVVKQLRTDVEDKGYKEFL